MVLSFLRTPWVARETPRGDRVLVFASRFDGRSPRSALRLMRHSGAIGRSAATAPGCLGSALMARPIRGSYYTLSVWQDEESLAAFSRRRPHRSGVKALYATGPVDGVLMSWWADAKARRPGWREVVRRTAQAPRGRYAGPQNAGPGAQAPSAVV